MEEVDSCVEEREHGEVVSMALVVDDDDESRSFDTEAAVRFSLATEPPFLESPFVFFGILDLHMDFVLQRQQQRKRIERGLRKRTCRRVPAKVTRVTAVGPAAQ
jgi:hypothetical protein